MREIEFLPAWYPRAARRRRVLHVQGYSTLALIMGLVLWICLSQRSLNAAQAAHDSAAAQLSQSRLELKQLDEQLLLKQRLEVQKQIVSKLGLPVEMSRMIAALDGAMSKETSLVELNIDTDEQLHPVAGKPGTPANEKDAAVDRKLKIKVVAIAPSDVDLANMMEKLINIPFFEDVHVGTVHDKTDHNRLMREFEVSFAMDLNRAVAE